MNGQTTVSPNETFESFTTGEPPLVADEIKSQFHKQNATKLVLEELRETIRKSCQASDALLRKYGVETLEDARNCEGVDSATRDRLAHRWYYREASREEFHQVEHEIATVIKLLNTLLDNYNTLQHQ